MYNYVIVCIKNISEHVDLNVAKLYNIFNKH